MEQRYWLARKRASVQMARDAISSEARLAHYELAGRYSLKAVAAGSVEKDLADVLPPALTVNRRGTLRCTYNG
jgi:hypothetical protein